MALAEGSVVFGVMMALGFRPARQVMADEIVTQRPVLRLVEDVSVSTPEPVEIEDDYWGRLDRLKPASTRSFVRWLKASDVSGDLSHRALLAFYAEYCEFADVRPLSERQLVNHIKDFGIKTLRPSAKVVNGKQHRPTIYRIRGQQKRAA